MTDTGQNSQKKSSDLPTIKYSAEKFYRYAALSVAAIATLMMTNAAALWEYPFPRIILFQTAEFMFVCALLAFLANVLVYINETSPKLKKRKLLRKLNKIALYATAMFFLVALIVSLESFSRIDKCVKISNNFFEEAVSICSLRQSDISPSNLERLTSMLNTYRMFDLSYIGIEY